MYKITALAIFCFACLTAEGQAVFTPPVSSQSAVAGVRFTGKPVGESFKARFRECDTSNTCDGNPLARHGCRNDLNRNSVLLQLKNDVIFYDAKMALDTDGSPYSRDTPGSTDQPQTSFRYPLPGKPSINADRVPFIVIPLGGFDTKLGVTLKLGDVAAVVYQDKRIYAVVGDEGPKCKIGEGSIQLHELLSHKVCRERNASGDCTKIRDASIEGGVLYFIFPNTHAELLPGLTPENMNSRINAIGAAAWQKFIAP